MSAPGKAGDGRVREKRGSETGPLSKQQQQQQRQPPTAKGGQVSKKSVVLDSSKSAPLQQSVLDSVKSAPSQSPVLDLEQSAPGSSQASTVLATTKTSSMQGVDQAKAMADILNEVRDLSVSSESDMETGHEGNDKGNDEQVDKTPFQRVPTTSERRYHRKQRQEQKQQQHQQQQQQRRQHRRPQVFQGGPQVEQAVKRKEPVGTPVEGGPVPKRPYAQAASRALSVAVVELLDDGDLRRIDQELADEIRQFVIGQMYEGDFVPTFEESGWMLEAFMVTASCERSLRWLQELVPKIDIGGKKFAAVSPDVLQGVKVAMHIPGAAAKQIPSDKVVWRLKKQNPQLPADGVWRQAHRSDVEGGVRLVFRVDETTASGLAALDWRPYYEMSRLKLWLPKSQGAPQHQQQQQQQNGPSAADQPDIEEQQQQQQPAEKDEEEAAAPPASTAQ